MTKYYSNKPDFPGDPAYPLISSSSYFKSMSDIMDDIEAAGKVVTDEGVEDLYVQNGEASLGTTKDSTTFDKSLNRIFKMVSKTKKIHSDIMQNIDSKFTKGMDAAFVTLNDVNGANKPYKSKYTKQTVPKKVLAGYKADGTSVYIDTTEQKSYTLSEILDGKASPIQAAKDVYDDRIKAVKEMMAKKDQLSDEQIKALEGKSAEEIVAVRYPGQLPDYQRLKASRYYEENKESLQYVDMALKVVAFLGMAGGAILAPATGGTSLTVSYASMAYLAADSAYSAFNGHTMITGNQLSTEDRVWAGIDAAVTLVSMGSAGYLAKLAKSGKNGSTLLKGLATAGKHADDVNDVSKVIYSFATDQDPNAALQNLVLGQVMGLGMNSAGNYIGKKFGTPAVDLPGAKASHLDVSLQGKQIPKLDPANVRLSSRPDLHLKASPADTTLAKLKTHPTVSADVPKIKQVSGDSATKAIGGVKPGDVDVPKVKGTANPSPSQSTTSPIKNMPLEEYEMYRTKSVINPDSDTMTLGKYEPTIRPDGTQDWSTPGPNSYISKAGDTTYFSLGDDWDKLTKAYNLDSRGKQMFEAFNKPALDDAVAQGKTIRFSHNPKLEEYKKSALRWEWDYLQEQHGYKGLKPKGGYWYGIK
ncbi:hypothetical protein [Streptococcus oralis]|uniref:hypothetical protein n=1 Tax=Streptococcus oralis TaxID=1303 RepID=UPI000BBD0657|nr:hypothetical protein [Streptococcus oralis]ATF56052.1 hypothetical protein CO686_00795 [Streptococcus oralis]